MASAQPGDMTRLGDDGVAPVSYPAGRPRPSRTGPTPTTNRLREPRASRSHFSHDDAADAPAGELVRMASKGNEIAWRELTRRYSQLVFRVARRCGLSVADANDVQQATWTVLLQHLDGVRDPERIGAWLATTARRESVRLSIRAGRQVPSADPLKEHLRGNEACAAADAELTDGGFDPDIQRALDRLPAPYRRLIGLLISDAGLSYAEVAEAMGIPIGSVGPMRSRGLALLRRDLELCCRGA
jgi:RNA polymerase sigma factor (sigma-70 family)